MGTIDSTISRWSDGHRQRLLEEVFVFTGQYDDIDTDDRTGFDFVADELMRALLNSPK